jgi:predicted nucleic acid-binding protein
LKLVLDTNVILKALIKDSVVRGIILSPKHQLLIPEDAIDETRKHLDVVAEKSGLSESEIDSVLDGLLTNIRVIPAGEVLSKWKEAEEVMAPIDKGDTPFVAAAMSAQCDGIWSDDKDLGRQKKGEGLDDQGRNQVGVSHTSISSRLAGIFIRVEQ